VNHIDPDIVHYGWNSDLPQHRMGDASMHAPAAPTVTRRTALLGLAAGVLAPGALLASPAHANRSAPPTTLALPNGFPPEGIAIGGGPFAFFGSRADGSIYRANLLTGEGRIISQGPGTPSLGLKLDAFGRLYVCGGTGGDGRIVDTHTGAVLAHYQFTTAASFVNDVILGRDAAWFTDSTNPVLYRVPLLPGGRLPAPAQVRALPLSGDIVYRAGINANGIALAPDGHAPVIVQSNTGGLFRVDPHTGAGRAVDLGGDSLVNGDGLLVEGNTLFAVQNQQGQVAKLRINADGTRARVLTRVTDPRFNTPTTVASFGDRLYLPNAAFATAPTPATPYTAVAIPRP
jgi:sugar lactone lactonase YvrE